MRKPHKHAELIKAWADGAQIEFRTSFHIPGPGGGTCFTDWKSKLHDSWHEHIQYRIKPEPKPDYDGFYVVGLNFQLDKVLNKQMAELKLTFRGHGMDMKLINAEVLK